MRISELLIESNNFFEIDEIVSDINFETLALSGSNIDKFFCTFIENEKYLDKLSSRATMIITKKELLNNEKLSNRGVCISKNPKLSYFKLHNYLSNKEEYKIENDFDTLIGQNCNISNLACISNKNVKIGNNVIIEEFVSIRDNVIIGDNTIIRSGAVIGGEGFEFIRQDNKEILPVKHIGWLRIGKNVEIQHNTCIDKAIYPWDNTIIGDYCKFDNLTHIGHGVKLGDGVFFAAGAFIAGRTEIGENSWVGVGTIVRNGILIGKNSKLNMGSVVTTNVGDNESVSGNFAIEHSKFINFIKSIR